MKLDYRSRLLATTLLVGAGLLATPAAAQNQPQEGPPTDVTQPTGPVEGQPEPARSAEGEPVEQQQDIIVTGSRIPQPNLESAAPVTVVSNQDIKLQGTTRVEDLLNTLPSVAPSQTSGLANGATGTATLDLRGLGSDRTLVLVNGRRLLPGDPNTAAADVNVIPAPLVRRVEVLTGGASSTYGADAVAGVVNFIMDTNFTGIRIDAQYSVYNHNNDDIFLGGDRTIRDIINLRINAGAPGFGFPVGNTVDGAAYDTTVSMGTAFDDGRGNAVVYFGYRKVDAVTQDERDYSACVVQNTSVASGSLPQCGGSATSAEGNFFDSVFTNRSIQPGRTFGTNTVFNFAPTNYYQRPDERYVAGFFANYEINDSIKPYLEFMFMDDRTIAQIAPSGNFGNTLTINCDNPLLGPSQRAIVCRPDNLITGSIGTFPLTPNLGGPAAPINFVDPTTGNTYNRAFFQLLRRNVEGGPRRSDLQHTSFRGVLGFRGDLSNVWSYDAYYQYGRTNYNQIYSNEFSVARLTRALDVVDDPNVAGIQPICRSALEGVDPNCVPYDVLGRNVTQAAINYLSATGFQDGVNTEQVANVSVTGLLGEYGFRSPLAEDGVGINVGLEYRKETLELQTDNAFQTGDLTGQGAPTLPINGSFDVKEFFAEAQIPIIQKGFVDDLSFNVGYRHSKYETSGGNEFSTDTYKFAGEFAPVRDIRFRATYNRAVRAPNIQELFATQFVGLSGTQDPCADVVITAANIGCQATGLAVGAFTPANPAEQYNALLGGNPALDPEKATTKTVGVVLQPRFIPRLAISLDYYDIEVESAIQGFGADAIINDCVSNTTSLASPRPSCALINRDPAGSLWLTSQGFIDNTPVNIGGVRTKGYEINGSFSQPLGGFGSLSASYVGTLLKDYITNNGLADPYECAGFFGATCSGGGTTGSGSPLPKYRHKARLSLQAPDGIGLSVQWRHIGKVRAETTSEDPTLSGRVVDPGSRLKAMNYIDLAATFTVGDNYNFRLGVNNVFDKEPPMVSSTGGICPSGPCNGNTYPGLYDALGRYLFAGITLDF
jgi:outer membrane receptor protein involved in Fe transport